MKPPKRVCPSADQAMDTHSGSREFAPTSTKSGLSSSTIDLFSSFTSASWLIKRGEDDILGLKVKDLNARCGGSAQPVSVGRKDKSIDNVAGFERVEVLALVEVPEHCDTVLAS